MEFSTNKNAVVTLKTEEELRDLVRDMQESLDEEATSGMGFGFDAATKTWKRRIEAILPAPRTLAEMSPKERAECQWMQAEDDVGNHVIITELNEENQEGKVLYENGGQFDWPYEILVPLPHLPRMEWPGNEQDDEQGFDPAYIYRDIEGDKWEYLDGKWVQGDSRTDRLVSLNVNHGLNNLLPKYGPYTRIEEGE